MNNHKEIGELFDANDKYREPALKLDRMAADAVRPLFKAYIALGYSVRQISHIISGAVRDVETECVLENDAGKNND